MTAPEIYRALMDIHEDLEVLHLRAHDLAFEVLALSNKHENALRILETSTSLGKQSDTI